MKRNNLWDEKNSTDQSTNLLQKEKRANLNITIPIEKQSMKKECPVIGKIYLITNNINGKRYVGQTIQPIGYRWRAHIRDSKIYNYPLYRAIIKYGPVNFGVIELESTNDLTLLDDMEKKHIVEQKSFIDWKQGGYNLTTGGYGHHNVSDETKAKLSKLHKGIPKTKEHNRKVGLANRGKPNGRVDKSIVSFINDNTGQSFTGLRKDFYKQYNLDSRRISDLIKGRRQSHKGWRLL